MMSGAFAPPASLALFEIEEIHREEISRTIDSRYSK
jgi:hypothetical protein